MEGKKKKRKATEKQLKALRKGRATLAKKRKGRYMGGIDGRKKPKSKGKRTVVVVAEGANRRRHHRRPLSLMGELGAMQKPKDIQAAGMHVATSLAGAVLGSVLVSRIPVKDPRIQAIIPLVVGLIGSTMARQVAIQRFSEGVAIGAGLALLRTVAPQLKLAGEESLIIPEDLRREISAMGAIEQSGYDGAIERSGQEEYTGAIEQSGGDLETEQSGDDLEAGEDVEGDDIEGDEEVYTGYLTQANM